MVRKISELASKAFYNREKFKRTNTEVKVLPTGEVELRLWGNLIALRNYNKIYFRLAGWNTVTTRERLKAIGIDITTRQGVIYYKGQPISDNCWYELMKGDDVILWK